MSGAPRTALDQFADFTLGLDLERLPPAVIGKAKACLLDSLSAAVTFGDHPRARAALASVSHDEPGHRCRILGSVHRASAADAAFVNGVAAAATGRMDTHPSAASHPGTVVVPAVLAGAEHARCDGATLIAALVAGYEVMCRLGGTVMTPALAEIFRPTSLSGPTGAALGAALVLGLSRTEAVNAASLATQTAMGLNEWAHAGTNEGAFHSGFAARNGLASAFLGAQGVRAAASVLEGQSGLLAAFGRRQEAERLTQDLGSRFEILSVLHKPASACVFVQTPCQLAEELCGRGAIDIDAIESIRIRVCREAATYPGCDNPGPVSTQQASRMSLQFSVASVLAAGGIKDSNWTDTPDAHANALAGRSQVVIDDAFTAAFPARQSAAIEIRRAGSEPICLESDDVRSLDMTQLEQRFRYAAAPVVGERNAAEVIAVIQRLEHVRDITELTDRLTFAGQGQSL